jgi:hypothetical protein
MALKTGYALSTNTQDGEIYYPLLTDGFGVTPLSVDEELQYENDSLTIENLNTENINGRAYGNIITNTFFPKIKLSSTWIAWGDSYTEPNNNWSPSWADYLATSTNTTLINNAVSGTRTPYLVGGTPQRNDPVNNPTYANYSSIVMYGVNDVNNDDVLYNDTYGTTYLQMVLGTALTLSLPQNKIQDPRDDSWTKVGSWTNSSMYTFGRYTSTTNGYIEKNVGTARYIAVRFSLASVWEYNWEIYVNGTLYSTLKGISPSVRGPSHTPVGTIFDLGEDTPNCIITIINKKPQITSPLEVQYLDFVCAYTDADLVNARPVLFLSIPRYNYENFVNASNEKRMLMNEAREATSRTCRLMGLPVSYFNISEASLMMYDTIHYTTAQSKVWARNILEGIIEI